MRRWLVIYDPNSGVAELTNVGVFEAETKKEAVEKARVVFGTTGRLEAFQIDNLRDGWAYYT